MWERGCELTSIPTEPRDCRAAGAFASLGSSAGPVVDALDLRGGMFGWRCVLVDRMANVEI